MFGVNLITSTCILTSNGGQYFITSSLCILISNSGVDFITCILISNGGQYFSILISNGGQCFKKCSGLISEQVSQFQMGASISNLILN